MSWWTAIVAAAQEIIVFTGDALGGMLGAGIVVVTFGLRAGLIPLMLPLAVRARERQSIVERMAPELRALKQEHRKDPDRLQQEINTLHARHGIKVVDGPGLLGALIQLPVLIALFQAVYGLSEGTPLGTGGLFVGLVASAVSVLSVHMAGQANAKPLLVISALLPVAIATWLGRGVGLYLVAFYAGSALQGLLMPRPEVEIPAAADSPT